MSENSVDTVRDWLRAYADRGVFRSFSERAGRHGAVEFRFLWLREDPLLLIFDSKKGTLRFKNLLPGIPAKSAMYREFKEFLKTQASLKRPEHRRINAERATVRAYNRGGEVSVTMTVVNGDFEYGVNRSVNLVHEIFMGFLKDGPYYEYAIEHLGLDVDEE